MYRELVDNFNIDNLINNEFKILAHIKTDNLKKEETLKEHINLCKKYFLNIVESKNISDIFIKFENIFLHDENEDSKLVFRELLIDIVSFHDMGKINPNFQKNKMKNNLNIEDKNIDRIGTTEHSIYSSIIYIDYHLNKIIKLQREKVINNQSFNIFLGLLILNSYIISRHHSGFNSMDNYLNNILEMFREEKVNDTYTIINKVYYKKISLKYKQIDKIIFEYKELDSRIKANSTDIDLEIAIYTYVRLMLSILIACDYYSTSEYMSGTEIEDLGQIDDINEFYEDFKDGEIYKKIESYKKERYGQINDFSEIKDINILRTEMFLDSEKELKENIEKNIFYLEAPTGSGKSNTANNLAFKLIEKDKRLNKIFYVYPFNTLVEQNINIFKDIYKNNEKVLENIAVINSLYPIKIQNNKAVKEDEDQSFENFKKSLLNRQFLNYPIVLTTHVTLFSYMFGTRKEDVFPFHQLINSVIILDEIQSYKNKIWREIIEFLNTFSKLLNIKIIIMSATLPNLNEFVEGRSLSIPLIKNREKYFNNKLFKDRVKVDFELIRDENNINQEDVFNDLIEKFYGYKNKKILVEFIKKKSAYDFFKELKERQELGEIESEIRLLTGDDNAVEREKVINEIKGNKEKDIEGLTNVILVSTQVIEAGVDIDMDIGFKDYSIVDSEEQFLGRINRSCLKKDSVVYFFKLDSAKAIYKEDVRNHDDVTIKNKEIRQVLRSKDFPNYFNEINKKIIHNSSRENELNTEKFFERSVGKLNFKEVEEKMKLIDDDRNDIQVFLNYELNRELDNGELETIVGNDIWEKYKNLLIDNSMDFAEKKVRLSEVRSKMNYFIYRIRTKQSFNFNDRIGDILYIDDGTEYFLDGKLNKEKFESNVGEFI